MRPVGVPRLAREVHTSPLRGGLGSGPGPLSIGSDLSGRRRQCRAAAAGTAATTISSGRWLVKLGRLVALVPGWTFAPRPVEYVPWLDYQASWTRCLAVSGREEGLERRLTLPRPSAHG